MSLAAAAEWLGGVLVLIGTLFIVVGAFGIVRMPDVFTRMHAASLSDTFGVGLVLIGLMFLGGFTLVTVKLVFLVLFLALASPVATHAVARAALHAGVKPLDANGEPIDAAGDEEAEP